MSKNVDVAILGAGTAGLSALTEVRKKTDSWVLIDGGTPGTTCARVGCMPSKAIIQIASDYQRHKIYPRYGIEGGRKLKVNIGDAMESVRDLRDIFVDRILEGTTDVFGENFIQGNARFADASTLEVDGLRIHARRIIIATGTQPIVPGEWEKFGNKIITTDEFFELEQLPHSMAVIGLGAIGVELGQALNRLGVELVGIEANDRLMNLSDPVVSEVALQHFSGEFPVWLGMPAEVKFSGNLLHVQAGKQSKTVEKILVAMGRRPNIENLKLEMLGFDLDDSGVPVHDPNSMQIGDLPVFIAGDVRNDRQILHESSFDGRVAGLNAVSDTVIGYKRPPPLAIAFTEPNIASVGIDHPEALNENCVIGEMRMGPVGRALIMGTNRGVIRVYADSESGRLKGASMIAPQGEHLAHLLAWSIQKGLSIADLLCLPFYHPTIEEALQPLLRDMQTRIVNQPGHPAGLEPETK